MSADRRQPTASKPPSFDPSVLDRLACPACMGPLRLDPSRLQCESCSRVYPIVEGIPVLIAERAVESKE
ncbi:MAG TPA: Trm112 family protein [Terracidiphilus sp.]|nr:Trm112 family protein [Terracidiphilus sp.]